MGSLRDKVSSNKYRGQIIEAVEFQNEASFYTCYDLNNPHTEIFKTRVKEIYVGDKYKYDRFIRAFAGKILPSVELFETIYSQLYRVWDSQDLVNEVNFKNKDLHDEALSYVDGMTTFWLNDFWEAYKNQFCSFIVVDLPSEQTSPDRPEPYPFVLDISRVIYISPTSKSAVKEIIFKSFEKVDGQEQPNEYWYWYNEQFYSKYLIKEDNEIEVFTNPHKLGHCPAHPILNEKFNKSSWLLKKGVAVPIFDDVFHYIFKRIESRKADLLYLNPIKQEPKVSCGYKSTLDKEKRYSGGPNAVCNGGWLYTVEGAVPISENGNKVLCPNCGKSRHASGGAGNSIVIDLDTQAVRDGKVDPASTLVKFITPDIDGVKEQFSRIRDEKDWMIKQCVGSDDQPTKSAVNELQQTAIFESKESVLKRIAENISEVKTKVNHDIYQLRYPESFISNRFNQGTKFYLHSVEELLETRTLTKDPIQKKQIDEQIIGVKYRNNPKKLNEEKLLYKLLPYSTLTDAEFNEMVIAGRITDNTAISLRFQFADALELFESQYGSIIEYFTYKFSESVPERKRIDVLKGFLIDNITIEKNVQNQLSGTPRT